jgi:UDP-glucose 4-epimerase
MLSPDLEFGTENRGWVGDNEFIFLDTKRIRDLGWKPRYSIEDGVRDTVKYLAENQWLFSTRE